MTRFYDFANVAMRAALFALGDLRVSGRDLVPAGGPLIVVANHLNLADPPILGSVLPRKVVFMAKEELFHQPGMSTIVSAYGAFPVKRNKPDRQALRQAIKVLEGGGVLGIFPEGKRNPRTGLSRAEAGVALIAARTSASVLPVGITGTEAIRGLGWTLKRPRISLNIGTPFNLPRAGERVEGETLGTMADFIMYKIADLLPTSYRGVYLDRAAHDPDRQELASNVESK